MPRDLEGELGFVIWGRMLPAASFLQILPSFQAAKCLRGQGVFQTDKTTESHIKWNHVTHKP